MAPAMLKIAGPLRVRPPRKYSGSLTDVTAIGVPVAGLMALTVKLLYAERRLVLLPIVALPSTTTLLGKYVLAALTSRAPWLMVTVEPLFKG